MRETQYKRKLVEYIKRNMGKGYDSDTLKYALMSQGYSRAIVELAIHQASKELAKKVPILKEKPVIKYEILDEHDNPITIRKSFWKRFFGI